MAEKPLISVVIPCFNAALHIKRAVKSVLAQTEARWELFLVDNNSTDETLSILKELAQSDERITVLEEKQKGANFARNLALSKATAPYVHFLDADDELLPNSISVHLKQLNEAGSPDLLAGNYLRTISGGPVHEVDFSGADPWQNLMEGKLGCTCSNVFKRESLLKAGGWNTDWKSSQDNELMLRMLKQGGTRVVFDHGFHTLVHRENPQSMSSINVSANLERLIRLRFLIIDHLEEKREFSPALRSSAAVYLLGTMRHLFAYDPQLASRTYDDFVKRGLNTGCSSPSFKRSMLIYRIFGFTTVEKWRATLKKTLGRN